MTQINLTRRAALALAGALLTARPSFAVAGPAIHVVKDPSCGCCGDWIAILRDEGFSVTVEEMEADALQAHKRSKGIPDALASCHTAQSEGYVIEGHVPAADIRRLLAERPHGIGLSVPGMPWGAPGMGPETEREAYDVLLIGQDGTPRVYAHYPAA